MRVGFVFYRDGKRQDGFIAFDVSVAQPGLEQLTFNQWVVSSNLTRDTISN